MITVKIHDAENRYLDSAYGGDMSGAIRAALSHVRFMGKPDSRYLLRDCLGGLRAEVIRGKTAKESLTIKRTK